MKILKIALLAGLLSTSANAGFEQFNDPVGYMNVFENSGGSQGGYLWGSGWGLVDLQAITSDNRTFELLPNINNYGDGTDAYWVNIPAMDGNKWLSANTFYEKTERVTTAVIGASFSFDVTGLDLDSRYTLIGFVKVLDPNNDYQPAVNQPVTITSNGTYNIAIPLNGPSLNNMVLQAGWEMTGLNANPETNWGSATVTATDLFVDTGDTSAPTPDTMNFVIPPYAISDQAISMTATNATDDSGVEYYFTCTAGGGNDSGWQLETTYVDSGLNANVEYTYTVIARDFSVSQNSNAVSAAASTFTLPTDNVPPAPSQMSFTDTEASSVSIQLTAITATDASIVEYYFDCVSGPGNDSGWQSSPIYVDEGLSNNTAFAYTVIARDISVAKNSNGVSSVVQVSTTPLPSATLSNSLQGFTGDSTQATTRHDLAMAGFEIAETSAVKTVVFDGSGATFGDAAIWENRNTLRTIVEDYGDYDFEISATFITSNTSEQAAFIGVGPGVTGGYGIPDWEVGEVNSLVGEVQANWSKLFSFTNGVQENLTTNAGISTVINRIKLVHDSVAETVTVFVDTAYDGTFSTDFAIGPNSTTNIWNGTLQRVYIAAGAGVLYKDLEIISDAPPVSFDVAIAESVSGGGTVLNWEGALGQTYEVQYTTSLTIPNWQADTTIGDIYDLGGPMSATSTVGVAQAFYRFILK